MSPLEIIETEFYSTRDQVNADIASPQYQNLPAFRAAIERKIARSWDRIKDQCIQTPDLNAPRVTTTSTQPIPEAQGLPDEDLLIRVGKNISFRVGAKGAASQVAANQAKGKR